MFPRMPSASAVGGWVVSTVHTSDFTCETFFKNEASDMCVNSTGNVVLPYNEISKGMANGMEYDNGETHPVS